MAERKQPLVPSAHAQAFAEAQTRLAARRRARAAAEEQARAHAAAASTSRRAASTATLRARLGLDAAVGSGSSTTTTPSGPPALVQRLGATVLAAWDRVDRWGDCCAGRAPQPQPPAFRVSQVDAELLDEELLGLLRAQVADALRYVRDGAVAEDWGAEVELGLRAALFKLSVWDHDATYGAALQNLRFADGRAARGGGAVPVAPARWQKAAYGVVTVGGRYAWAKWEEWLRDHGDGGDDDEEEEEADQSAWRLLPRLPRPSALTVRRLARATTILSDVYAGAAFVSFLLFLRCGRYRTLLDRVLRMRLVPPTSQVHREVSFEYLNRQLVWHAFTEFLLFLLPLVGVQRWRRWLARTWRRTASTVSTAVAAVATAAGRGGARGEAETDSGGGGGGAEKKTAGPLAFLPERTCAICYEDQTAATSEADLLAQAAASSGVIGSADTDVTNPYEAVPCGCVYCYVCVATRVEREAGDGWPCLRCRAVVQACRPWRGDVLEPAAAAAAAAAEETSGSRPGTRAGDGSDGSRPSSSSTTASGGPPHKTVGFADDVKGDDATTDDDGSEGIVMNEVDGEEEEEDGDVVDEVAETADSDSDSEAYEEEEDGVDELE